METFDLTRLTSTTFERLVRALCFDKMGPSGTVYSSGPDGARDFTFEGIIPGYEPKGWDGYLVIQAKFREKPQGGTSDVLWLEGQLKGELEKFKDRKANLRPPKYFIIATNISLSGADGRGSKGKQRTGGHTKISNHLDGWKDKLKIEDYDIWSGEKIIDLLIASPNVRYAYAAWVTPGDVLSAVLDRFKSRNPEFPALIGKGLRESLRRDQHARLRDAGSVAESPIRVSQVFIDIPVKRALTEDSAKSRGRDDLDNQDTSGVVQRLAERSKEKLDPESVASSRITEEMKIIPSRNRVVILGGPGQGKSTASMFLAQLFRAELLSCDPKTHQDDNVRGLVPEILQRAAQEGISKDLPRRYPVFVSLPRFADSVSKAKSAGGKIPSLLSHIALELSVTCDREFDRDDLRVWLAGYPWIAIFDGLDEVPPSGERKAVVEAIASFNSEVIESQADVLVVVTTRPQGYDHDLDPEQWEHWQLEDLPPTRALEYAKALGYARYPSDPFRREDVLSALSNATTKPATSRLMISPLQVTIMYLIVDTGGSVPAARWSLFNEYFETLRKRERAKGGENQKILERHWSQLAPIHQRAGLVLQTDSEHVGSALSSLDVPRFTKMLHEYLRSCGYDLKEVNSRADELMSVALDRLVLLSSKEEGKIAFDVRSLQEFMAAAAITSGNERNVEDRLGHIARLSHWRHTFLIAASRCFSEDNLHHLRPAVVSIPRDLDSMLPDYYVRRGASLSLEMFIDGLGVDHPKSRKLLAQHALDLLALGPESVSEQLLALFDEHTSDLVHMVLREKMLEQSTPSALAAWKLAVSFANRGHKLFVSLLEECWPSESTQALQILSILSEPLPSDILVAKARSAVLCCPPSEMRRCSSFLEIISTFNLDRYPDHSPLLSLDYTDRNLDDDSYMGVLSSNENWPLRFSIHSHNDVARYQNYSMLSAGDNINSGWAPLIASANFTARPSAKSLSEALLLIIDSSVFAEARELRRHLPWPIGTLINSASDENVLKEFANRASIGEFGDAIAWRAAEARWAKDGLKEEDFIRSSQETPFGYDVATIGAPVFKTYQISHGNNYTLEMVKRMLVLARRMSKPIDRSWILELIQFSMLGLERSANELSVSDAVDFFELLSFQKTDLSPHVVGHFDSAIWDRSDLVSAISISATESLRYTTRDFSLPLNRVLAAFLSNPNNRGLVVWIALYMCVSEDSYHDVIKNLNDVPLHLVENDAYVVRASLVLLSLARGDIVDAEVVARELCESENTKKRIGLSMMTRLFEVDTFLTDTREGYVVSILRRLEGQDVPQSEKLRDALLKQLNAKRSKLTMRETWIDQLALPSDAYQILMVEK